MVVSYYRALEAIQKSAGPLGPLGIPLPEGQDPATEIADANPQPRDPYTRLTAQLDRRRDALTGNPTAQARENMANLTGLDSAPGTNNGAQFRQMINRIRQRQRAFRGGPVAQARETKTNLTGAPVRNRAGGLSY
jgi:hypothetical protein